MASVTSIRKIAHEEYPRSECSARMFHLWNANEKHALQWRYYSDPRRAHLGALIEARWSPVGTTIEVFNANSGRLLGQYTRKIHGIEFLGGEQYEYAKPQHKAA